MDIRVLDERNRRIVNVSKLSLEVQGGYVVGLTNEGKMVNVKSCLDEQEAEKLMDMIIECIKEAHLHQTGDLMIYV